jgi:hypothetical protein
MTGLARSGRIDAMPELRIRRMPIVVQDPGVRGDDERILTASVPVPWEDLECGPAGHRVHVVDYDATTNTMYEPVKVEAGDVPDPVDDAAILGDPAFHARNVYALVMRTLARFEFALGRRVPWYFRGHQLKVVPHAFEEMNSFYSREAESLVFGYYRKDGDPVFMCLSHDIVVHETTHAVLDGLRSRFMAPSSADQAAFHEGFADIVALLSVFAIGDVLHLLLGRVEGRRQDGAIERSAITAESLRQSVLLGLADEMEDESGAARANALRRSVNLPPDRGVLGHIEFREPHRRGEIVVAAVMRAFVEAWVRRLDAPEATQTKFVEVRRVVEEGADVARTLLTMAIRGLDYTPPVHLDFGDFLSAMLTADSEIRADDARYGLRQGLRDRFADYGIDPAADTDDGCWRPRDVQLTTEGVRFGSLQTDPVEMFRLVWTNRAQLALDPTAYTRIASVRPCVRMSPDDGLPLRETVAECLQYVKVFASELGRYGLVKPLGMPDGTEIALEGGSTLILDDYGRLKYEVHNRLPAPGDAAEVATAQRRLQYLWEQGHFAPGASFAARLARMHRLRAGEPATARAEAW